MSEHLQRFAVFKEWVLRWERIEGIYILEAVELPGEARDISEQDRLLRAFAARYGFTPPDVEDVEWTNAEVFREEARQYITKALVGGTAIGHSRWDVPPVEAEALADEFLALFGEDARFFCDAPTSGHAQILAPYGRSDFSDWIFGGGCVAVDRRIAAVFWMLDND